MRFVITPTVVRRGIGDLVGLAVTVAKPKPYEIDPSPSPGLGIRGRLAATRRGPLELLCDRRRQTHHLRFVLRLYAKAEVGVALQHEERGFVVSDPPVRLIADRRRPLRVVGEIHLDLVEGVPGNLRRRLL